MIRIAKKKEPPAGDYFTPESIERYLKEAGVKVEVDVARLTLVLGWSRLLAENAKAHPIYLMQQRLAAALAVIREIVPPLNIRIQQLSSEIVAVTGSGIEDDLPSQREIANAMAALLKLKGLVDNQLVQLLLEPQLWAVHSWQFAARPIEALLMSAGAPRRAAWRFIKLIAPHVTGEKPTDDAIQTFFKKHRPPTRRR